jgi:hypothetical protein
MSPNNDDVVKVDLAPEEKAQVESKPIQTEAKTGTIVSEKETVNEPVKAEVKEEVKEKVKPTKFEDVFKTEKTKKEVKEMTPDERTEYETLKQEKIIQEHQNAYEKILEAYEPDEREILQKRLDVILKEKENPEEDLFGKLSGVFTPKQVAYITTAIASLEEIGELEKVRAKRLNTAVKDASKQATDSANVKKTLTEIADLKTVGDKGELSPSEKRKQLVKKGQTGNYQSRDKAIDELLKMEFGK